MKNFKEIIIQYEGRTYHVVECEAVAPFDLNMKTYNELGVTLVDGCLHHEKSANFNEEEAGLFWLADLWQSALFVWAEDETHDDDSIVFGYGLDDFMSCLENNDSGAWESISDCLFRFPGTDENEYYYLRDYLDSVYGDRHIG